MFFIYDLTFILFAVVYFPYTIMKGKWHGGFGMRLGFFPKTIKQAVSGKKNIWFHAVSVGEVIAVLGLIKKIKAGFPGHQIILSTVTKTGYTVAQSRLSSEDIIIYAPLDFSLIVWKYIHLIKPEIYITAETEIWPNLFSALSRGKIPIVQVNGRISDKGYAGYKRIRFLLKRILRRVTVFCMQSQLDADRIIALGAPVENVHIVGNIKFDEVPQGTGDELQDERFRVDKSLWIAGSTHPGEETIVLKTFKALGEEFPNLHLVIAPRHVERAPEVQRLIKEQGLESIALSHFLKDQNRTLTGNSVVVVDMIGYLRSLYQSASVVFVGKSLTVGGGQNIIEPAALGKPVLIGPQTQNFKDVVRIFLEHEGVIQVKDALELLSQLRNLFKNPSQKQALGTAAQKVVRKCQGATARTERIIAGLLPRRTDDSAAIAHPSS